MARIIIVGGGVAGLSAGIRAQLMGHSATVYERHFKAGGNLTAWNRGDYHIDNCIHWLTGTNPVTGMYKMWCELGALGDGIELHKNEALFTYDNGGERISLGRSADKLGEDMLRISPEDKREIKALIKAVKAVTALCGISYTDNSKKSDLMQMVAKTPSLLRYLNLSTGELAARFKSPTLRGFIESLMTEHFSSLALIMVFATFTSGNGDIPYGSSEGMAERMTERFISLGGRLKLKSGVSKINVKNGKARSVTLDDGSEIYADYVIVTADPAVTFGTLLDKELMPRSLSEQYADPRMKRFSAYHTAFACDREKLPFVGDFIFEIPEEYREELRTRYLFVREFSHEKSFAPEGKSIIQTMTYCFEEDAKSFIALRRDPAAYKARKQRLAEIIGTLIEQKMPELGGKLSPIDVWTPATYRRFVGSEMGSFMSFALPAGVAPRKIPARIKGLSNVLLATQWQSAPGGLPIAAEAGINAMRAVALLEKKQAAVNAAGELKRKRRARI